MVRLTPGAGRLAAGLLTLGLLTGCVGGGAATRQPAPAAAPTATPTQCRAAPPTVRPHPDAASLRRAGEVLGVVAAKGWNPGAPSRVAGDSGGLYVNWRADWNGADPAVNTNILTSGLSDNQASRAPRHDPLTDLVVLRDVDAYLATGAADAAVSALGCKLQPVVAREFDSYSVFRAWVYQDLVDLDALDPNGGWAPRAERMAASLAKTYVNATTFVAADPRRGTYRPDYAAQTAAALVDAGSRFGHPDWATLGEGVARRLVQAAPDPGTGLFAGELRPAPGRDVVVDPLVKVGSQAQLLDALLSVYDVSHDPSLLAAVRRAFTALQDPHLGLLDPVNGGYYFGIDVDGSGLRRDYKETRFAWMQPLLEHWSRSTAAAPPDPALLTIVRDRLWQPSGGAYVYRVASDFSPYRGASASVQETWVSTEAVGIAVQVLLGRLT